MTGSGVLDLFAYNQDAYVRWVEEIGDVAAKNALLSNQELFEQNPSTSTRKYGSRPASRRTNASKSSVAPLNINSIDSRSSPPTALKTQPNNSILQSFISSSDPKSNLEQNLERRTENILIRKREVQTQPLLTSTPLHVHSERTSLMSSGHGDEYHGSVSITDDSDVI